MIRRGFDLGRCSRSRVRYLRGFAAAIHRRQIADGFTGLTEGSHWRATISTSHPTYALAGLIAG